MKKTLFAETVRKAAENTREAYKISLINIFLRIIFILVLGYTYYALFGLSFEGVFSKVWGTILSLIWFFLVIPLLHFLVQLIVQPGKIYKELISKTRVVEVQQVDEVLQVEVSHKTYQHDKKYFRLNMLIDNFETDDITDCFVELRAIDNGKEKVTLDFPVRLKWVEKKIANPKEGMHTIKRGERKIVEVMHANVKSGYLALSTKDSGEYHNDINATFYLDAAIYGKVGGVSRFPQIHRLKVEFNETDYSVDFLEVG